MVVLNLSSCLIKGKTSATSVKDGGTGPQVRANNLISGDPVSTVYEGVPYYYRPDTLVSGATVSAENLPTWMSLDASTGVIQGTVVGLSLIHI